MIKSNFGTVGIIMGNLLTGIKNGWFSILNFGIEAETVFGESVVRQAFFM